MRDHRSQPNMKGERQMIEPLLSWLSAIPGVKAAWELIRPWSEKMTIGKLAGTVGALALCTMAWTNYHNRQDTIQWREEAPARAAATRRDIEATQTAFADHMVSTIRAETERDESRQEQERVVNDKRRMLERLARNRSLIVTCPAVPPYVLSDLHEVPMYFNDDREVMEAYTILVVEPSTMNDREEMVEALFEAMAEVTNSTERFPELPSFAAEFTAGCYR